MKAENAVYKYGILLFVFLLVCSCTENRNNWLQKYQNTKCTWFQVNEKFRIDSIQSVSKLSVEYNAVKNEVDKISIPIQTKIAVLNDKISDVNIKYLSKSRKISEAHEQVYGHISTLNFEKKLKQNDENNIREVQTLENKITILQSKLYNNPKYQELVLKQNKIKEQITKTINIIKEKYTVTFDSLQKELDNQNYDYKYILQKLRDTEKQIFKSQREKIRANPCK